MSREGKKREWNKKDNWETGAGLKYFYCGSLLCHKQKHSLLHTPLGLTVSETNKTMLQDIWVPLSQILSCEMIISLEVPVRNV